MLVLYETKERTKTEENGREGKALLRQCGQRQLLKNADNTDLKDGMEQPLHKQGTGCFRQRKSCTEILQLERAGYVQGTKRSPIQLRPQRQGGSGLRRCKIKQAPDHAESPIDHGKELGLAD